MTDTHAIDATLIQQFLSEKLNVQLVQEKLLSFGWDHDLVSKYVSEFRRKKIAQQQSSGFFCLTAGAIVGFISCVLALVDPIPELYHVFLYGLTSVAIGLGCFGMYKIFE
ncbi:MAG: hypothetical protein JST81_11585 [Bacteroidetes bacterium]|nr:hypothetical protein [Bacteroidota bacterium]